VSNLMLDAGVKYLFEFCSRTNSFFSISYKAKPVKL
jgi:hypothetical protein